MRIRNVKGSEEAIKQHKKSIQNPERYKGKWSEYFGNQQPIHIEIGMGKGTFMIENAKKNPQINYIGFEKFSAVLFRALEKIDLEEKLDNKLDNLCFVRMDASNVLDIFEPGEISRIYLNFSDPWPKEKHEKRRLTHFEFLSKYAVILKKGSLLIQKTDNENLYRFSKLQMEDFGFQIKEWSEDLHNSPYLEGNIMTEYERKFVELGKNIYMLSVFMKD